MDNQKKYGYLNIYRHMGTQNIIGSKLGGLDVNLDFSELFDFTLDDILSTRLDVITDYSECFDFTLDDILSVRLDAIADSSECFDFTMGDSTKDYVLFEQFISDDDYLLSENDFILKTEDEYYLIY